MNKKQTYYLKYILDDLPTTNTTFKFKSSAILCKANIKTILFVICMKRSFKHYSNKKYSFSISRPTSLNEKNIAPKNQEFITQALRFCKSAKDVLEILAKSSYSLPKKYESLELFSNPNNNTKKNVTTESRKDCVNTPEKRSLWRSRAHDQRNSRRCSATRNHFETRKNLITWAGCYQLSRSQELVWRNFRGRPLRTSVALSPRPTLLNSARLSQKNFHLAIHNLLDSNPGRSSPPSF